MMKEWDYKLQNKNPKPYTKKRENIKPKMLTYHIYYVPISRSHKNFIV